MPENIWDAGGGGVWRDKNVNFQLLCQVKSHFVIQRLMWLRTQTFINGCQRDICSNQDGIINNQL